MKNDSNTLTINRMTATKNVLILEDQPDAVAMLRRIVQQTFTSVSLTVLHDLASAYRLENANFELALIDLRLPDGLSIDWLAEFKSHNPATVAVVTSLYDDDELVFAAMRAGADGYLLKGEGDEPLLYGLSKVLAGEPPISPAIARKLMQHFRASEQIAAPHLVSASPTGAAATKGPVELLEHASLNGERLTPREEEVLGLIGSGLMIKQVAAKLGISYHTVNDNIKAIYRKLDIHTRAQAATEAAKRGLIAYPKNLGVAQLK
jgi:two-component system, NarL family, nitrate/nitrite response regulator NarL